MTQIFDDRFQLLELIGKGGIGEVYRGRDLHTDKFVAVKLLKLDPTTQDMKSVERFHQEAVILGQLDHPNIVKIVASGKHGDQYYIVMEYLEGPSLLQVVRQENPLPIRRVLEIALDISDALTHAHRLNIIHRDIKPTNVLFSHGVPHLTDFGVARLGKNSDLTQTGLVIGSYNYLSPEACNGKPTDERSDIWAFGVMLFEMLTGQVPFVGDSPGMILNGILNNPVPDLTRFRADIPVGLQSLVYAMLEKRPEFRVESIRKVGAELERVLRSSDTGSTIKGEITQVVPTTSTYFPNPVTTAKPSTVIVLPVFQRWLVSLFMVGLVVVGALVFWWGSREPAKEADFLVVAVAPVEPEEYMILVGQLEPINTDEREVTRFIVNDLQLQLEQTVGYTHVKVRQYPYIISSEAQAQTAAQKNKAALVVWGNYTADRVTLHVDLGSLEAFDHLLISQELLEKSVNVRVEMTDAQHESIAPFVLGDMVMLHSANGEAFKAAGSLLGMNEIQVTRPMMVGQTIAVDIHNSFAGFWDNPQQSIRLLDDALLADKSNPILYHFRGLLYMRMGEAEKADQDLDTASRLSNQQWYVSDILRAGQAFIKNDSEVGIALLDGVVDKNPQDWFVFYLRGTLHYLNENNESAQADYEKAMRLDPSMDFPYISLSQIAIRQGKLDVAATLMTRVLEDYTDPSLINRILLGMYGLDGNEGALYTYQLSAYGNFIAGQYDAAVADVDAALTMMPDSEDLLFLKGISLCSLDQFEEAENAYTQAIEADPDFTVLHLMRAEVRFKQGDMAGVAEDVTAVQESPLAETLQPFIELGLSGDFSCKDFLQNATGVE